MSASEARPKGEILKEFAFYVKCSVPAESIYEWVQSLPDSERKIVFDEVEQVLDEMRVIFHDVLKPMVEQGMRVLASFFDDLPVEDKDE